MRIYKMKNYEEMSRKAAIIIAAQLTLKPDSVLGLATGSTPVGAYRRLAEMHAEGGLDFSRAATINLDEYRGLAPDDRQSYRYFMQVNLFDHINIGGGRTNVPNGLAEDAAKECHRYDGVIASFGGIDMQLLGIGQNGHIGFNEPGTAFKKDTHCVDLTESTIEANRRFFGPGEDVPKQAYTMGIGSIMGARRILLLVSGREKAGIIRESLLGPITPAVPASVLQLHGDVILVGDEPALSLI